MESHAGNWLPVLSGTPQGAVLGPHLFLLHINNIHEGVSSTTRLFADDCLIYKPVTCKADEEDFQSDLNKMVNWSTAWGMKFNPSKCKVMRLTRKRDPEPASYMYKMLGDLEETKDSQYLGVYLQNDLRWNKQVNHTKNKATKVLNFLKRNFHHTSSSTKEKLYKSLVRPHLDYATAAWDPYTCTSKNINHLEKVQNAAARFITNTCG